MRERWPVESQNGGLASRTKSGSGLSLNVERSDDRSAGGLSKASWPCAVMCRGNRSAAIFRETAEGAVVGARELLYKV